MSAYLKFRQSERNLKSLKKKMEVCQELFKLERSTVSLGDSGNPAEQLATSAQAWISS